MKACFPIHSWRQQVALDVGTAAIRASAGSRPLMERSSRLGNRCCVSGGVVVDETMVAEILRPLFDKTRLFGMVKPYVLACTPSDATREERERLYDAVMMAGASSVWIIPEPLAAAVGAGIDVSSPYAQMVVDIGEGVTDCAVIKMSRMQATAAVRVGCSQMRVALAQRQAATGTSGHPGSELEQGLYPALHTIIGLIDDFLPPPQNLWIEGSKK